MSRPSSSRRHSLKVLVASLAIAAVAALTLPLGAGATPSAVERYLVVFGGTYALDGSYALGGNYALNHQYALDIVRDSGGTIVADLSRDTGVMIVDAANQAFASHVGSYALVDAVGRSFAWKGVPSMQEAIARGDLTVLGPAAGEGDGATDPLVSQQWDMRMIRTRRAQAIEDGRRKVQVGVLDTGVDSTHADFRVGTTSNVDTTLARSFVTSSPDPLTDAGFHGTHVAGTIAAQINGFGIVGVAPGVTLVPVKVCETSGYCFADSVIQGIHYAGEARLEVINMSFFADDDPPANSTQFKCLSDPDQRAWRLAIERQIEYARFRGVAPVAAMGNNDLDLNHPEDLQAGATDEDCDQMPTEVKGVTAVVALGPDGTKSEYSSYGAGPGKADVSAPGGDGSTCADQILSTLPGNSYGCFQGTSMASPHAAGVAALIVSRFGVMGDDGDMKMPVGSVDRRLKNTSIDIGISGYDKCYGKGRVDALRAVTHTTTAVHEANGCSDY
ncbi:MAG: S8 family serine peptidase [Chloroflexi bacterium]|nr:S8 family serine peptidase [Chloroflexota bacterium]